MQGLRASTADNNYLRMPKGGGREDDRALELPSAGNTGLYKNSPIRRQRNQLTRWLNWITWRGGVILIIHEVDGVGLVQAKPTINIQYSVYIVC